MESLELAKLVAGWLDNKKAQDVQVIGIADISSIGDYFVIAGCGSNTQVKALSDEVEMKLKGKGIDPYRIEGVSTGNWIVMDYGSVLIHIFHHSAREFYKLERIWADGEKVDISDILKPDTAE